jgi:hypothetical protein
MNYARSLAGTALVMLSSAALASPTGHAQGSAHPTSARARAADTAPKTEGERGGVSAGIAPDVTMTHDTIAGRPATIAHLPAHAPLTLEERRKLRSAGYGEINNGEKGIYYCRKVRAVSEGVVNDCFQFDVRIPRSKEESKDKDKDSQRKDSPGEKDAPARPAGRVAYG